MALRDFNKDSVCAELGCRVLAGSVAGLNQHLDPLRQDRLAAQDLARRTERLESLKALAFLGFGIEVLGFFGGLSLRVFWCL